MRVMVTGSNRGIGLEFVRQLLARGATVFATARQPEQADALAALKRAHGAALHIVELDVADPHSVVNAHAAVTQQTDALDLLINNAAILIEGEGLGQLDKDNLVRTLEVNVAGPMLVTQQFMTLLAAGTQPRLVYISSGAGSIARARSGLVSYRVSKAALNMLMRVLDHDLKPKGIASLALNPGWVATDMGGADASLQAAESVRHQLQVIDALTLEQSSTFLDYDGSPIAW